MLNGLWVDVLSSCSLTNLEGMKKKTMGAAERQVLA